MPESRVHSSAVGVTLWGVTRPGFGSGPVGLLITTVLTWDKLPLSLTQPHPLFK